MITLSEEQQKKIEENRAAALLKKQQAVQKLSSTKTYPNLNTTNKIAKVGNNVKQHPSNIKVENTSTNHSIKAVCRVFGENRFIVEMPYHSASIELFKTINGRKYETDLKKWSFPLTEQSTLVSKFKNSEPEVVVHAIPNSVINVLLNSDLPDSIYINWNKIDKTLRDFLMPFQVDGIKFGVYKKGKCLIADDMGLGKTIQALGIVHYFKENWPLLIVCPSSMRFPWQEAIKNFLPSVQANVQVLTSGKGQTVEGDIVISSYDLMKNCFEDLAKKRFGVIIFDESHFLKSSNSLRTKVALQLAKMATNIILLSGTPALSRPQELYSQICVIDPSAFKSFYEFGMRYCNGRKDKFGWNFSGSSNLEELEMYLKKKIMIRRLKSEVIKQLPSKIRKLIFIHPKLVKAVSKQIQKLESKYSSQNGNEKHSTLLSYYSLTATAKLNAVCEYIEDKLENVNKFLIFAHHVNMIKGICELLNSKNVNYIKIDGAVGSENRKTLCDKFQNEDRCRVAVLSIKAANCGITLTAAQLVIFAELYWNPGELTQAEDRAHRIGQQDSVLVEYLIAKGTADEHLWKLIDKKLNVLNKVGLSKDNFKVTETRHLNDPNQPTLTSFLSSESNRTLEKDGIKLNDVFSMKEAQDDNITLNDDFLMRDAQDDDIFNSINLEGIENEYQISNKRRKTTANA